MKYYKLYILFRSISEVKCFNIAYKDIEPHKVLAVMRGNNYFVLSDNKAIYVNWSDVVYASIEEDIELNYREYKPEPI